MKDTLAVQMYTIRDFLHTADDLARSLERISAIGYRAVQLSAVGAMSGDSPAVDATQARKMLDDNGLRCIATHRSWDDLSQRPEQEIEFHQVLGCDFTAIGMMPASFRERGKEGYADWVREAEPVIARLKEGGVRFGYHNHALEFERSGFEGGQPVTLFDGLIESGNPDLLLELDLYWISHAGANPERIVERCRGKMPVIHIKDKEMVGQEAHMAPIGEGNLDWAALLPACQASGVEWIAVEQDTCRRDPFDCLQSSFDYLSRPSV